MKLLNGSGSISSTVTLLCSVAILIAVSASPTTRQCEAANPPGEAKSIADYMKEAAVLASRNDRDGAKLVFDRIISLDPEYAPARMLRGGLNFEKSDYELAIADLSVAIRHHFKEPVSLSLRANCYFHQKKYEDAIADLDNSIRLKTDSRSYALRGTCWFAKKDFEKAFADLNEAIRLKPNDASYYYFRGTCRIATGDLDKGIEDFGEAIRFDPKKTSHYKHRGEAWSKKREFEKSVADYDEAIRINPKDDDAYQLRAKTRFALKQLDQGLADINEAIRLNPKEESHYKYRCKALLDKNEFDKARADCDVWIQLTPGDAFAYFYRSQSWVGNRAYDIALADLIEANRIDPKNDYVLNKLAWIRATCPEAQFRNGEQAVSHATVACKLTGWKQFAWLDTLAAAYAESGKFDEAVKWQSKAIEIAPESKLESLKARLKLYESHQPCRDIDA